MATYTYIDVNDLLPGEPVTSAKMLSFNDRAEAIAEGASGAPKIQTAAINDSAVTTAKLDTDAVTSVKLDLRSYTDSGTIGGGGEFTSRAPGVVCFFPMVVYDPAEIDAYFSDDTGRPAVRLSNSTGSVVNYTVTWYYVP